MLQKTFVGVLPQGAIVEVCTQKTSAKGKEYFDILINLRGFDCKYKIMLSEAIKVGTSVSGVAFVATYQDNFKSYNVRLDEAELLEVLASTKNKST